MATPAERYRMALCYDPGEPGYLSRLEWLALACDLSMTGNPYDAERAEDCRRRSSGVIRAKGRPCRANDCPITSS